MTRSSIGSGELATPQSGTVTPVSVAAFRDQMTAPLRASSEFTSPVAPIV
jgi:hypothetical protein